ncbi:MAG: hypothetical protein V3V03_06415 [Hyphomonadaceae bacterium]
MKITLAILSVAIMTTGCITAAEHDRGDAFAKCDSIKVVTSRDRCISKAINEAERNRQDQAREMQEGIEEAEQRELNRVIAGAEKD